MGPHPPSNLRQDEPATEAVDVDGDGRGARGPGPRREQDPEGRRTLVTRFKEQPVLNGLLVLACIALIVVAYTALGPPSSSSGSATRTATAKYGVVQSTVSGSGNVQSAEQLNLGFKTSGTVTHIYVTQGQHVTEGQLLATLDPQSAEVTLEQAKASLQSAEANLAKEEESEGESSGQGSSATGATASAASAGTVSYTTLTLAHASAAGEPAATTPGTEPTGSTTPEGTTPATTTTPSTPAAEPKKASNSSGSQGARSNSGGSSHQSTTTQATSSAPAAAGSGAGTGSSTTKQSAATREANLASARAAVKSDKLSVQSAEQAVQNTRLYAPSSGTIVTLSGEVGETVSGTGTSKSASSSSSSSGSGSSAAAGTGSKGATGASSAAASSSSGQGSSSSSSFAVLSNLESLQLVVPLSESEIGNVHEGQIATVTIEALSGRKVAAHVASVSQVPTSSSGAVSYDVTFQLDQSAEGLKVGMSATAEVVVKQEEGVNVPTSAVKAGSVTVVRDGAHVTQRVTTGLAGDSSTIVLSGLKAGEEVVLPSLSTSGGASLTSRLSSRLGGSRSGGIGGGGFAGGGAFPAGPPGG